jgi:hypothetical protein
MRRSRLYVSVLLVIVLVGVATAWADSTDEYIKQLTDKDPAVRAKAAYELSCG